MKYLKIMVCILYLTTSLPIAASEKLLVVVHKDAPVSQLSKSEVIDLFMGKYTAFNDGNKTITVELPDNNELKKEFYQLLINQSLARVNAYWARLKFTGRKRYVSQQKSESEIIQFISNNEHSIGYINAQNLNDNLKVVYVLDK